jgi:hypothetical protein
MGLKAFLTLAAVVAAGAYGYSYVKKNVLS